MADIGTLQYLSDGSPLRVFGDPDTVKRKVREAELEIQRNKKEIAYKASPEYQPGEVAPVGDEIGTFGKVGRGALAGLVTIPTEIASSVGYGLSAAGYDAGEDVVKTAEMVKEQFAPDIEGLGAWAEVPKALIQFGVPGGVVLKALGNSNKLTKLLAVASAEGMVAESDMKSFGDTFLPNPVTKTKELAMLDGQEKAFAALYNKGVNGLEAAAVMAGIPLVLTASGAVINTTLKGAARVPGVKQIGKGVGLVGKGFSQVVDRAEKSSPLIKNLVSSVRFRGKLPDKEVAEIKALKAVELGGLGHANLVAMNDLSTTLAEVMKKGKVNDFNGEKVIDTLNDFLYPTDDLLSGLSQSANAKQVEAARNLIEMDKAFGLVKTGDKHNYSIFKDNPDGIKSKFSLFRAATNARKTIDEYSERIKVNPEFLPEGAQETLEGQLGLYGATQYRMFLDDEYLPEANVVENAIQALMKGSDQVGTPYTREQAVEALTLIKSKGGFVNKNLSPEEILSDETLKSVMKGPLLNKKLNDPAVKEFLGEYTARRELPSGVQSLEKRTEGLLSKTKETVGRQAAVISKSNYFKRLEGYNDRLPEDRKMFLDYPPETNLTAAVGDRYIQVPNNFGYGPLRGKYIKEDYFSALEQQSSDWNLKGSNALAGWLFGSFLGTKSMVQKAVTVYNPEAQVRNTASALGFVIANGNVPKGKDMAEAFASVYGEIGNKFKSASDKKELIQNYVDRGVIGTQAQLGEINSLAELAVNQTSGRSRRFWQGRVDAQNNFMTQLYRAGDDVWKVANYEIEKKKLLGMVQKAVLKQRPFTMKANTPDQAMIAKQFGLNPDGVDLVELSKKGKNVIDDFISEESAFITRNNVPNYARVPSLIQNLRQLPLGNFIAYPAELFRSSFNVIGRSITEISSDNADMRARGLQRLLGYSALSYGVKEGVEAFGLMMTGANKEQLEAYKRSSAQEWEKNSTFVPIRTDKDGNILEAVNASYTLPYDYLTRPVEAVLNAYNNGVRKEEDLLDIAFKGGIDAVSEFTSPFIGAEMLTERGLSALRNENSYGQALTNSDQLGDKVWAGFAHLVNGIIPSISPAELNTNASPMDTVNYDALRTFKFGDLSQAALVESGLIPRERLSRISRQGKKLDLYREAAESFTAIKVNDMSPKKIVDNLGYRAYQLKDELGSAIKYYESLKNERGGITQEEILYRFKKSNEMQYKLLRDFSIAIEDARTQGATNQEIAFKLRKEIGGVKGWRGLMNNSYMPMAPKASITNKLYEAEIDKRRNVSPVKGLMDDFGNRYGDIQFPEAPQQPPTPQPMSDRLPGLIQETVESLPDTTSNLYDRASQFLRSEEEKKLMGGS